MFVELYFRVSIISFGTVLVQREGNVVLYSVLSDACTPNLFITSSSPVKTAICKYKYAVTKVLPNTGRTSSKDFVCQIRLVFFANGECSYLIVDSQRTESR